MFNSLVCTNTLTILNKTFELIDIGCNGCIRRKYESLHPERHWRERED